MIQYQYDSEGLAIQEKRNGSDVEFLISIRNKEKYLDSIHHVRDDFNKNNIHTDVIFHVRIHEEFQVIVREDYCADFILSLFKHKLLTQVRWAD